MAKRYPAEQRAFGHPDPDLGLRAALELAAWLERTHPSAAASIREGLHEMFTVRRLDLSASLEGTLTTTNPVESMNSVRHHRLHHQPYSPVSRTRT